MTVKIDNILIRQINREKPQKVREFRDRLLKGFVIRQQKSGTITYFVSIHKGTSLRKQRRIKIGEHPITSPGEARLEATRVLAEAKLGLLADNKPIESLEVFLKNRYFPWIKGHLTHPSAQEKYLKVHFGCWFSFPLTNLNKRLLDDWRTKRLKAGTSASTVNRNVAAIRSVLSKAVEWEVIDHLPLAGLKPLKTDKGKPIRTLSTNERTRLLKALEDRDLGLKRKRSSFNVWRKKRGYNLFPELVHYGDHLTPIVLMAYHTGMRRGEIFSLQWSDIDYTRKRLVLRGETTKSSQTRIIPINKILLKILENWRSQSELNSDYVFPGPNGERLNKLRNSWNSLRKQAVLKGFRFHDLRADFASRLVNSGISLPVAQKLLGHSSPVITMKFYASISDENLLIAVEAAANTGNLPAADSSQYQSGEGGYAN